MSDIQVMDDNFTPKKRGRPALINIDDIIATAQKNKNSWCSMTLQEREAVSAARQLKRTGLEVSTRSAPEGRVVYFRDVD